MNEEIRKWIIDQIGYNPYPGSVIYVEEKLPVMAVVTVDAEGNMNIVRGHIPGSSQVDLDNLEAKIIGTYDLGEMP